MLVELFGDKNGNISSMNFVWLISIVTIIGMWIALSFRLGTLQHVTGGDALWFATLFSGKVLQNFFERRFPEGTSDIDKKSNMFEDNQGKTSVSRVIWVFAVLGIVFTWAYISWVSKELQHFSTGDAAWFAGLFGSKIGGTIIERDFGIKSEYEEDYKGLGGDVGDGDAIPSDYAQTGYITGSTTDLSKDSLIKQLQETIKVQNQFNKNLVRSIDPNMNKSISEIEDSEKREAEENKENYIRNKGED